MGVSQQVGRDGKSEPGNGGPHGQYWWSRFRQRRQRCSGGSLIPRALWTLVWFNSTDDIWGQRAVLTGTSSLPCESEDRLKIYGLR